MKTNISYKLKYYKYKEKYINYKQNGGTPKVFNLYTTGIVDGSSLFFLQKWVNIFRNSILRNIHPSFNHIIIKHYDPMTLNTCKEKLKMINAINEILIINDNCASTKDRKITSEFILEPINLKNINIPHLILDMAHIFDYLPKKRIQLNNNYGDISNEILTNINSVYIGWYRPYEGISSEYLASSDFVKVYDDGYVSTYIDRIIYLNLVNRQDLENFKKNPAQYFRNLLDEVMSSDIISIDNPLIVANIIINIIMTTSKKKLSVHQLITEVNSTLK